MTNTPEHDKRERIEVNRYIERGFTHAEIIEIVREVFDTGNVPSWIWNHPGMADVINTQLTLLRARATRNDPARIMHLVDGWLAEDAGTDPGEVAAEDVRELVRAWIAGRDGELEQD